MNYITIVGDRPKDVTPLSSVLSVSLKLKILKSMELPFVETVCWQFSLCSKSQEQN